MAVLGVLREALALTYCAMCGNQLLRRSVLADIKKDVSALRSKADRGALFSGPDGVEMTESRSHREWLLSTQDKCALLFGSLSVLASLLDQWLGVARHAATNETLASALRTVADTEDVGKLNSK